MTANKTDKKEQIWQVSHLIIPVVILSRLSDAFAHSSEYKVLFSGLFAGLGGLIGFAAYSLVKAKKAFVKILSLSGLFILCFIILISVHPAISDSRFTPVTKVEGPLKPETRAAIVDYLKQNRFDPSDYYIENDFERNDTSLALSLWDKHGIENENPDIIGNPGKCGTLIYDLKNRKVQSFALWK